MNKNILVPSLNKVKWPSSNTLLPLVAVALASTVGVLVFQSKIEAKLPENKSVAWFTANPKEANVQNKLCFENPSLKETENCVNSLHALEMMHLGTNS